MQAVKPIVIKMGGSTLGNHDTSLRDIVTLQWEKKPIVLVHGGGKIITDWLNRMKIETNFVRGIRVTDKQTLEVVIAVLAGLINKELVASITVLGGKAIGLSGIDGGLIKAKIQDRSLGYVGEVTEICTEPIEAIMNAGYIPVIATAGFRLPASEDPEVKFLNMNGDTTASKIAIALRAERLIFLTNISGVQDNKGKLMVKITANEAKSLIESGTISGGMIPKVEECLSALVSVSSTQIIDGRVEGSLIAAVQGEGSGTRIESGF